MSGDQPHMPIEPATEAFYRRMCEHAGVALVATDDALNIRVWNVAASRIFGAGADSMIGTPVIQIIPQRRRSVAERKLQRAVTVGDTGEFEFACPDDRGQPRDLAAVVAPVVSDDGTRIGASLFIRDITKRLALQREVFEARKMASLAEMAGAIAHHFNNIAGGVVTSIDFAIDRQDAVIQDRVLRQTSKALARATKLMNGLLAFSGADEPTTDLSDLTELVLEVADEADEACQSRGIAFELTLPALPVVPVPRGQVLTALRNISRNAIDAMPDGGVLTIDAALEEKFVAVRIKDTGCGIDDPAMVRLFEPFWTTKGELGSTQGEVIGLGLAVAHGVVQVMGGSISVSLAASKGVLLHDSPPTRCELAFCSASCVFVIQCVCCAP